MTTDRFAPGRHMSIRRRWHMADMTWWVAAAASLVSVGCAAPADERDTVAEQVSCSDPVELTVSAEELDINGRADAAVGVELLGALSGRSDNVLLSPLSLRTAFGQVYAGASGASRQEVATVFELGELGDRVHAVLGGVTQRLQARNAEETEDSPAVIFRPANRSFFDTTFESSVNDDWATLVEENYGVCSEFFDMNRDIVATRLHINHWVADQTHDLIPDLVKFLPEPVALVVVNALYFRASWATPFSSTSARSFTTRAGAQIEVPTMHEPALPGFYAEAADWQAVAIPYSDPALEMVVILPATSAAASFEPNLDGDALDGIFAALEPTVVDLWLPKFEITSKWALRTALMDLGMTASFVNGDFDGIAEGMPPIFEVFHDVAIAIDENGTEAAAATAIVFGDGGTFPADPEYTVVVDRTFYVAIRDREARSVLFFARIGDPSAAE
jgi:serpin B